MKPATLVIPVAAFSKRLSRDEVLLLAYLVWWEARGTLGEARWFRCPQEQIRAELRFSISTQTRLIKQLEEHWCIETRKVGFPGKREMRLVRSIFPVRALRRAVH